MIMKLARSDFEDPVTHLKFTGRNFVVPDMQIRHSTQRSRNQVPLFLAIFGCLWPVTRFEKSLRNCRMSSFGVVCTGTLLFYAQTIPKYTTPTFLKAKTLPGHFPPLPPPPPSLSLSLSLSLFLPLFQLFNY